jgi:hypothetical protein
MSQYIVTLFSGTERILSREHMEADSTARSHLRIRDLPGSRRRLAHHRQLRDGASGPALPVRGCRNATNQHPQHEAVTCPEWSPC